MAKPYVRNVGAEIGKASVSGATRFMPKKVLILAVFAKGASRYTRRRARSRLLLKKRARSWKLSL